MVLERLNRVWAACYTPVFSPGVQRRAASLSTTWDWSVRVDAGGGAFQLTDANQVSLDPARPLWLALMRCLQSVRGFGIEDSSAVQGQPGWECRYLGGPRPTTWLVISRPWEGTTFS
jgi:hypothetical protein